MENRRNQKIPKTKSEIINDLKSQLKLIEEYCKFFDEGKEYFAKEIATKLRILFHNTNNSKSLIFQLKLTHIKFLDSCAPYNPKSIIAQHNLIKINLSNVSAYYQPIGWSDVPYLPKQVSFESWWVNKKIIIDKYGKYFNRKKLILEVANTDGGAHFDPNLNEDYHNLSISNSLGWIVTTINSERKRIETPLNNPVLPHLRQIATEVLESFKLIDIENESKLYK